MRVCSSGVAAHSYLVPQRCSYGDEARMAAFPQLGGDLRRLGIGSRACDQLPGGQLHRQSINGARSPRSADCLARLEGFEPPTGCLEGSCSVRLSYRRSRLIVHAGDHFVGHQAGSVDLSSPAGTRVGSRDARDRRRPAGQARTTLAPAIAATARPAGRSRLAWRRGPRSTRCSPTRAGATRSPRSAGPPAPSRPVSTREPRPEAACTPPSACSPSRHPPHWRTTSRAAGPRHASP